MGGGHSGWHLGNSSVKAKPALSAASQDLLGQAIRFLVLHTYSHRRLVLSCCRELSAMGSTGAVGTARRCRSQCWRLGPRVRSLQQQDMAGLTFFLPSSNLSCSWPCGRSPWQLKWQRSMVGRRVFPKRAGLYEPRVSNELDH